MSDHGTSSRVGRSIAKLCGADVEVFNSILGVRRQGGSGAEASDALLREVEGVARRESSGSSAGWGSTGAVTYDAQDRGRKYLPSNGGCIYVDLNHLEFCLPEVLGAHEHVAAWHAMLRIVREAWRRADARLPAGQRLQVIVNNSDGLGHSYGSHLDFLLTRRCWDRIFHRKLHYLLALASFQSSSIVYTGAGKVGSENGRPPVDYQLAQRADFFETLTGMQTTRQRPIVNSRDESLCGPSWGWETENDRLARLHVIFFDSTLSHVTSFLKVGVMQIVLAMLEQDLVDTRLILDDPLDALLRWSHDPDLHARARLVSRRRVTAVELQEAFFEAASRFVAAGGTEGIVPRADEIIGCWGETLELLRQRDFDALASRLDWVLKRQLLERAARQHGLSWNSPQLKVLDHLYASLDPEEGLYWACERSGATQPVVSDAEIERFVVEPPQDTRAWLRSRLLRRPESASIVHVDWDAIRYRIPQERAGYWAPSTYRTVRMNDPRRGTREEFERVLADARSQAELLDGLGAEESSPGTYATSWS